MKIYLVGGAVRDKLLGLSVKEKDWVVVGATVSQMLKRGFRQVGKEFPVFLSKNGEEYALARTERKVDKGYKGFTFDTSPLVTLEEDLERRDLTINAMAETPDGELIDPYHGKEDLNCRLLRHVSSAFSEDPVRILRVGRFLARYAHLGFHVAPETYTLMRQMVEAGEVDALVAERVWKELERALGEKNPEKFFEVLDECGALPILFPTLKMDEPGIAALIISANISPAPLIRFAALFHATQEPKKNLASLFERYRIPNAYRELTNLTAYHYQEILKKPSLNANDLLTLFNKIDIFRRPKRFQDFLQVCEAIAYAHHISFNKQWFLNAASVTTDIDIKVLLEQGYADLALANKLREIRLRKIQEWISSKAKR